MESSGAFGVAQDAGPHQELYTFHADVSEALMPAQKFLSSFGQIVVLNVDSVEHG